MVDGAYRLVAGDVERTVVVRDGRAATAAIGVRGRSVAVADATELSVVLDAATWRHDIPTWRWLATATPPEGWTDPGFDVAGWRTVPHLHPVITARAATPSFFRARVPLPASVRDLPVTFLLGGLDGQDWSRYAAWLDGEPLDAWTGSGTIREPRRIVIEPGTPAHDRLRFGGEHLLAVRCEGLERSHPDLVPGELEHHFFADWLVDQAVVAGPVDLVVDDFRVRSVTADGERHLELTLDAAGPDAALEATIRYAAHGAEIRKSVTLRNRGDAPVTVMDVVLDRWSGDLDARYGGRGQPAILGPAFAAITHPAGVARVAPDRVELVQMPGRTLAPGEELALPTVVLGGSATRPIDAVVRDHILGLRPRPERRITVYSALGWYDFTNPADPLPELTQELVDENLRQLAELATHGARFDVLMLDDWWDWTDLGRFRPGPFPDGSAPVRRAAEAAGMRLGIWWATTRAVWSVRDRAGIDAALANAPDAGAPLDLTGGEWRWLEEFTNLMIGEPRFCLAAEPYRGHALASLPAVLAETDAALFKLDCAVLHCTSSDHGHRPGRHSMEPMVDAVTELVARAREAAPDLRVVLYWGFRSPWWLGVADAMFDKGLLMEAATVASAPARTVRHSLTTNVDQAIHHARFMPRRLQDSLGVWVGDVAWCNRIGREEWAEAFLVDLARGSDLVQLWGDLTLFDEADRRFLGDALRWFDAELRPAGEPGLVGGDARLLEPYGYRLAGRHGEVITLVNPTARVAGPPPDAMPDALRERYPHPGPGAGEPLAPYEVRILSAATPADPGEATRRTAVRPTRDVRLDGLPTEVILDAGAIRVTGRLGLPAIALGDEIHLWARLQRDGQWAYEPEPHAIVRIGLTLDALAVRADVLPRDRDRNGPGSPWTLLRIPAGPSWSGRDLDLVADLHGPPGLRVTFGADVVDAWWKRGRTFRP
ncbi:MAG: hypothetical protein U0869_00740 [Chloroflexota bacterium]